MYYMCMASIHEIHWKICLKSFTSVHSTCWRLSGTAIRFFELPFIMYCDKCTLFGGKRGEYTKMYYMCKASIHEIHWEKILKICVLMVIAKVFRFHCTTTHNYLVVQNRSRYAIATGAVSSHFETMLTVIYCSLSYYIQHPVVSQCIIPSLCRYFY